MRLSFLVLSTALGFVACFDTAEEPTPFSTEAPVFDFRVGERRLLLRDLALEGKKFSYRNFMMGESHITKDTVYRGNAGLIVEERFWESYPDTVYTYSARHMLVTTREGIDFYTFNQNTWSPFLFSLFKPSSAKKRLVSKSGELAEDTAGFSDRTHAMLFPLTVGATWQTRAEDNPWNHTPLEKEYLGQDTLAFRGHDYVCGVFSIHSFEDIQLKSWISALGLLRAEVLYPHPSYEIDTLGVVRDTFSTTETYTLIDRSMGSLPMDDYLRRYQNEGHL